MALPYNTPPLHTQMEYEQARKVAGMMRRQLRDPLFVDNDGRQAKELSELARRLDAYKQLHKQYSLIGDCD